MSRRQTANAPASSETATSGPAGREGASGKDASVQGPAARDQAARGQAVREPAARDPAREIVGLYARYGQLWDQRRGRSLFEKPWLDRMVALIPPGGTVLDLGCGGGDPLAGYLRSLGFHVTGVDASPALLALASERFPDQEWILADMRGLDLGRAFDAILAWDSFFHLAHHDQRAMFAVFDRHIGPRGALLFTSGPAHGVALGEFAGEPLHHASLDPEEYCALLGRHGFAVVEHVVEDPQCGGHTVWLARRGGNE